MVSGSTASDGRDPEINTDTSMDSKAKDDECLPAEGFLSSFTDEKIRAKFIKKVYLIILTQLSVTAGITALFSNHPAIRAFFRDDRTSKGLITYMVSYVIFAITYFGIICVPTLRRKHPINIITLSVFTLALSFLVGIISVYHDAEWVWTAMAITGAITLSLTLFAFQTKWDFTGWGPFICAFIWTVVIFGFLSLFYWQNNQPIWYAVYCALIGLAYSMFLVYHTQRLLRGKKGSISPEEYIYAAIRIYIDIVMIFLIILRLGRK